MKKEVKVKLPKIILKHSFAGDFPEWLSFWNSFGASVHNSSGISGIDKVSYLRRVLKGKAVKVILCLPLSESNILKETTYFSNILDRSKYI